MATNQSSNGKTELLGELFTSITGESVVTEEQHQTHNTTGTQREATYDVDDLVHEIVDRFDITTSLNDDELVVVVRGYHYGKTDREIARMLGDVSRDRSVARARIRLHLFRERDFEAPFDIERLQELRSTIQTTRAISDTLGVSESTVRFYQNALAARREAKRVDGAYQDRFAECFEGSAVSEQQRSTLRHEDLSDAIL